MSSYYDYGDTVSSGVTWKEVRLVAPHRCSYSGRIIWPGRKAMMGTRIVTDGVAIPIYITKWVHPATFTLKQLNGTIQ
jgi:hypothetical protein